MHTEILHIVGFAVPSQTTFELDGATATAPVETNGSFSVSDENDRATIGGLHQPAMTGRDIERPRILGSNAISEMRPPITAGPIARADSAFNIGAVSVTPAFCAAFGACVEDTTPHDISAAKVMQVLRNIPQFYSRFPLATYDFTPRSQSVSGSTYATWSSLRPPRSA